MTSSSSSASSSTASSSSSAGRMLSPGLAPISTYFPGQHLSQPPTTVNVYGQKYESSVPMSVPLVAPSPVQVQAHETGVLSRLHALFSPLSHDQDTTRGVPPGGEGMLGTGGDAQASTRRYSEPALTMPEVKEREAIKVFIVTWNMGDALPKGDLTVLLGEIPNYEPPSPSETEADRSALPSLPTENKHPYHIVVVAGQECPTPSGVPRGLGGVMKGVSVRTHLRRKDGEDKKKDRDRDDSEDEDSNESELPSRIGSPLPPQTPQTGGHKGPAQKGWSTMLDDWFCGPPPKPHLMTQSPNIIEPPNPVPASSPSQAPVPIPLPIPTSPSLNRSYSAPANVSPSETKAFLSPRPIPYSASGDHLAPGLLPPPFGRSPLSRSETSLLSSSATSSDSDDLMGQPPPVPEKDDIPSSAASASASGRVDPPELVVPLTEPARTAQGSGCYVHLVKERLMGMYLSIYVYKGCEHLVQGVDKDFVTAGLAGGRLGNKGGIGISLKLADHRFLFVNSHLAAHTGRVSARLANIEKIKDELDLDHFLPKDDPRSSEPDIADRFDSVFWCGDLNFRLDMSRLHAEWLVEQKRYDDLLMWDQLRAIMKIPGQTPFPGFQEGPIDFPPTFKYDVWKSVKATNRELRKSLRRSGTIDGKHRPLHTQGENGVLGSGHGHTHTLEPIAMEQDETEQTDESGDETLATRTDDDRRRSIDSSAAPSVMTITDDEDGDVDPKHIDASAYGSRHKAMEVAIKEKTKKLLSLVKMDSMLAPGRGRWRDRRASKVKAATEEDNGLRGSLDTEESCRRTSMSSLASMREEASRSVPPPFPSNPNIARSTSASISIPPSQSLSPPQQYLDNPIEVFGTSAASSNSRLTSSPPSSNRNIVMPRRLSILKRSMSGRSVVDEKVQGSPSTGNGAGQGGEIVMSQDYREGVYDTSKKQRVPSWCDRVLWKAHPIPDPEPDAPHSPLDSHGPRENALARLSSVFTFGSRHSRNSMFRTPSMEPTPLPSSHPVYSHIDRPLPLPPAPLSNSDPVELLSSSPPSSSPRFISPSRLDSDGSSNGLIPPPRAPSPNLYNSASPLGSRPPTLLPRSNSIPHHPLIDISTVQVSPANPKITFDLASPDPADRPRHHIAHVQGSSSFRPRSRSDAGESHHLPQSRPHSYSQDSGHYKPALVSSTSFPGPITTREQDQRQRDSAIEDYDRNRYLTRQNSLSLPSDDLSASAGDPLSRRYSSGPRITTSEQAHEADSLGLGRTHSDTQPQHASTRDREDRSSFMRFLKDLPNRLHRVSTISDDPHSRDLDLGSTNRMGHVSVPRRKKGEVVCLHYGTIDDAGMRQLEGRSPAIFAAAVYV